MENRATSRRVWLRSECYLFTNIAHSGRLLLVLEDTAQGLLWFAIQSIDVSVLKCTRKQLVENKSLWLYDRTSLSFITIDFKLQCKNETIFLFSFGSQIQTTLPGTIIYRLYNYLVRMRIDPATPSAATNCSDITTTELKRIEPQFNLDRESNSSHDRVLERLQYFHEPSKFRYDLSWVHFMRWAQSFNETYLLCPYLFMQDTIFI